MGGLLAGQYVASPGALADPSLCSVPYQTVDPLGAVVLDGPTWLEGYYEKTGIGNPSDPAIDSYDPVALAQPHPELRMYYFVSNDLPDYGAKAATRLDTAMGTVATVVLLDTSHRGMMTGYNDDYASAVLDIVEHH